MIMYIKNPAFHQGLHFLLRSKESSETKIHHNLEIPTCDPFKYFMDNSNLSTYCIHLYMDESSKFPNPEL